MAIERHRYKGIARNGKIELEPGASLPEGTEVIVLFGTAKDTSKLSAKELASSEFVGMWKDREDLPRTNQEFLEWRRSLWERKAG